MEDFKQIMIKYCNAPDNKVLLDKRKTLYSITWHGNRSVVPMVDYLYKDSNEAIWLDRKYEKSHAVLKEDIKPINYSLCKEVIAVNTITGESVKYFSATEAAKQLNIHTSSIWRCLNGKTKQHKGYTFSYLKTP